MNDRLYGFGNFLSPSTTTVQNTRETVNLLNSVVFGSFRVLKLALPDRLEAIRHADCIMSSQPHQQTTSVLGCVCETVECFAAKDTNRCAANRDPQKESRLSHTQTLSHNLHRDPSMLRNRHVVTESSSFMDRILDERNASSIELVLNHLSASEVAIATSVEKAFVDF